MADSRWKDWLVKHPECSRHAPSHGHHDSVLDPNGCGHCADCHTTRDHDHIAGCPGC